MKNLKLSILILLLASTASAQPWGGAFNPEGPSSAYQIFTDKNKFVGLLGASDITVQQSLETLSYISASPTTINSRWNFNNGKLGFPKYVTCPASCSDGDMCYDSDATSGQRIYACESGTWTLEGDAGVGGSGDNITVNGTAAVDLAMNESSPSVPASGLGVKWQTTGSNPTKLSAYAAVSTSSVLSGVLSDETGSGSAVFATSPTITSPTISTSIALPADAVDAITEIASALKTGTAAKLATGTAGTNGNCAQWNANGDVVDSGAACGGGSGDSILINGVAAVDANFNESTPSTPASGLSVKWQTTGSSPSQITGYAAVNTSAVLAGVVSDETGTAGKLVFDTSPTLVTPNIGVATATSVNKVAITAPATSATLTIADGKTLTVNNTATIGTLTDTKFCTYTAAGTSIDCTSSGGGGGDSILINGTAVTDANFNESNPSTPASGLSVKWQRTGSNPDSVTGYAAVSTSAVLAGVISDETGSSGGVVVFSSTPTIVSPSIGRLSNLTTNGFIKTSNGNGTLDVTDGVIDGTELASNTKIVAFGITIDGGGSAITTGVKGYVEIPYAMTITGNTFLCDQSGSITADVWKDTYANYPPTVADTITASAKPTITTATKSQDTTLTGWTTSVSAGDIIGFNVDSASTVTRCHLIIKGNKS